MCPIDVVVIFVLGLIDEVEIAEAKPWPAPRLAPDQPGQEGLLIIVVCWAIDSS